MPSSTGRSSETLRVHLLAVAIGLVGGGLGVGFRLAVQWVERWLYGGEQRAVDADMAVWETLLLPTIGGLVAGLVLLSLRGPRGPFGIGEVVGLVATRKGLINPWQSLVQIFSSGCSIAAGGSIGREGANSQFGATLASMFGSWSNVSARTRAVLLGCGIAAGMASAYKAPIAGALFVMEVVLGNFAMDVFAPIVVASVTSTIVTRAVLSDAPVYEFGALEMTEPSLVVSAAVLGALCGFGGVGFRRSLSLGAQAFERIRVPLPVKMAIGGLIVGLIGLQYPEAWGNGQTTIEVLAMPGETPGLLLMVGLLVAKLVATSATVGSGALGGTFTPNLVVGAAFGAAFAALVDQFKEGNHHTEFALVGMAGLCAATTHAPITAVVLIFEMTGDYGLILPLMLCSILGSMTARMLDQDSIYTARLRAQGHDPSAGLEELAVHTSYVRDVMRADVPTVSATATFDEVLDRFLGSRQSTLYVVDDSGGLVGHVRLHDVKSFLREGSLGTVVIAHDLSRNSDGVHADQSLAKVLPRFDDPELDELPVVGPEESQRLVGRLLRSDLVACLSDEILGSRAMRAKLKRAGSEEADYVQLPDGTELARLRVPAPWVGRSMGSLELIDTLELHALVVIRMTPEGLEQRELPHPETVLDDTIELVVLGDAATLAEVRKMC